MGNSSDVIILAACILNIQNILSEKTKTSIRTVKEKTMMAYPTKLGDKGSLKTLGNVSVRPSQYESISVEWKWQDVWGSTTYKHYRNQCISNLYSPPKRGWNFKFESLRRLGATSATKSPESLQVAGNYKEPGGRTSNTAMVELAPLRLRHTSRR